jgi:hypothetical protein
LVLGELKKCAEKKNPTMWGWSEVLSLEKEEKRR